MTQPSTGRATWRQMTPADLLAVERVGAQVHASLPESAEVAAERLRLFPEGCLVTASGYVIAHPCRLGEPPALNSLLGALPDEANALHLHDVALLPAARGLGLGGAALRRVMAIAARREFAHVTLVAVHGTPPYWARSGFVVAPATVAVASYGADARYMVRAVADITPGPAG